MKDFIKTNKVLLLMLLIFFVISIVSISSAQLLVGDNTLVTKQIIWYIVGLLFIILLAKVKNSFLVNYRWILYIISNLSLLGLLLFTSPINGARAWYSIPNIGTIQPSEFVKIILIIVIATIITNYHKDTFKKTLKDEFFLLIKVGLVLLIPVTLTFLQPDTGVVLIYLLITFVMLFVSGIRYQWFLFFIGVIIFIVLAIIAIYFVNTELFIDLFGTDFFLRIDRLLDWSNQSGFQLENGITAIGSAGLFGSGFSNTTLYFPEAQTDFIFAVFANNFGFIGSISLLIFLLLFDLKLISIALKSESIFNKLVLSGIIGMILYQQIQNTGMTFGLLPITGITLPFISYGGSSLLSYMITIAIILNINNEQENHYI